MQKTRGKPVTEFDVVLCCADPARADMCATLESYLTRAGFRVFLAGDDADGAERRRRVIENTADFVVFLSEAGLDSLRDAAHAAAAAVAGAVSADRNIVRVTLAGDPVRVPDDLPQALRGLARGQSLPFDPDRLAESLSLIQHSLSSDTSVTDRHEMRRWKRWFQFAAILVIAGFSLQTIPQVVKWWQRPRALPPVAPFTLYWSAFGERPVNGVPTEFPVAADASIAAGDRLRIAFSPSADGYAYVVAKDVRGRAMVLFPRETMKGASRVKAGQSYYAPLDAGWLTIDPQASVDAVYVFAGYDALQNLEELIEEPETPNNLGARRELIDQTVSGLLDGRHYQYGRRIWIRTTAVVDQSLKPAAGPETFNAVFSTGRSVTHRASAQPGLVSALVELTLKVGK